MASRDIPNISTQSRETLGTRASRRLRETGRLPAVLYGHHQQPVHLSVDGIEVRRLLDASYHLVELDVEGKTEPSLIKDVQYDYLGTNVVHLDLTRVDLTEEVEVEIEVRLTGEAPGLQEEGALLDQATTALAIRCRADSIPEEITHDVSNLNVGDSVTVADLTLPKGVQTDMDPDTAICSIQVMEEAPEEIEAEAGPEEPEVIGEAEGEGEEGAQAAEAGEGESS